jgi:hypothetical protein
MAGRETRARRLLPSFIAVAGIIACGQTEDGPEIATNPPSPVPDGSQAGNGNSGGRDSFGGTGGQVIIGGTAGSSGSWGGFVNPPCTVLSCPASLPEPGSSCYPAAGEPFVFCFVRPTCVYDFPAGQVVHAQCDGQTWRTDAPVGAGGAPGEASGGAPAEGGAFPEAGAPGQAGNPG